MDDMTRKPELEGRVTMSGGTSPDSFPHLCPYQPHGADKAMCQQITGNYQRNKAGCFGTRDHRNFGPCNSSLRKCVACLLEVGAARARAVQDIELGLCVEHAESPRQPQARQPQPTRRPITALTPLSLTALAQPRPAPARSVPPPEDLTSPSLVQNQKAGRVEERAPPEEPKTEKKAEFDVEASVRLLHTLTTRRRQVSRIILESDNDSQAARALGVELCAIQPYFSGICSDIGIPKGSREERKKLLAKVFSRYLETLSEGAAGTSVAPEAPEDELLRLFKAMSPGSQHRLLKRARKFK